MVFISNALLTFCPYTLVYPSNCYRYAEIKLQGKGLHKTLKEWLDVLYYVRMHVCAFVLLKGAPLEEVVVGERAFVRKSLEKSPDCVSLMLLNRSLMVPDIVRRHV